MDKKEFVRNAAIQFGAAMVKVMDESSDGIVGNAVSIGKVARHAVLLAEYLASELKDEGYFDEDEEGES